MPTPVAQAHKLFKDNFATQFVDEEGAEEYIEVWECDDALELIDWMNMHPLLGRTVDPDKLMQTLMDKKNHRMYIVGLALGDRVTVGDIDTKTGEILPGEYTEAPRIIYSEISAEWFKALMNARNNIEHPPEDQDDAPGRRQMILQQLASQLKK
jgi:hypothetical protein